MVACEACSMAGAGVRAASGRRRTVSVAGSSRCQGLERLRRLHTRCAAVAHRCRRLQQLAGRACSACCCEVPAPGSRSGLPLRAASPGRASAQAGATQHMQAAARPQRPARLHSSFLPHRRRRPPRGPHHWRPAPRPASHTSGMALMAASNRAPCDGLLPWFAPVASCCCALQRR